MAVTLVQSATTTTPATLTTSVTLGAAPSAGNLLVGVVAYRSPNVITSGPSGMTQDGNQAFSDAQLAIYHLNTVGGESATWSVTVDGDVLSISVLEFAGHDIGQPIDNTLTWTTVTSAAPVSPTVTPTVRGCYVLACFSENLSQASGATVDAPFVMTGQAFGNNHEVVVASQTTVGTVSTTGATAHFPSGTPSVVATTVVIRATPQQVRKSFRKARFRASFW